MNQTWKRPEPYLAPGSEIIGKWNANRYQIKRKLGAGAIGTVYLCQNGRKQAALKISEKSTSITMEVNVLKSIDKAQDKHLGPYLLDFDDWIAPDGRRYSFYVMEYVQGDRLRDFIKKQGSEWIGVIMLQLLEDLEKLHQTGWVFGDLKEENLIVTSSPARIRWIDVGGTTKVGRAIKEYTEFYDRGYWGLGSRRAEPSYDLFSFVMIFLAIFYPKRFAKRGQSKQQLFRKIDSVRALIPYRSCLKKAILGKYNSSAQMRRELAGVIYQTRRGRTRGDGKAELIESFGFSVIAFIYYLSYLFLF